ncbi:hypothetical protein [Bartonella callosciuri]|uniref:hypothetical protein n=1 Tax=Bartonella callosciuri TaxID=686223 RepID=UPI001FE29D97|nr:hypothetical protein [Bartonella callosciuri]
MKTESLADKFTSFGWHVVEIDGHDITQLKTSLESLPSHKDKPTAIIRNTIKGSGIFTMENEITCTIKFQQMRNIILLSRKLSQKFN